jgi:PAS domain S-box-containing protein
LRPRSLRAQLLLGTFLVSALVMTAVIVVVDHRQRVAIVEEVQRRGDALARNLAAISYPSLVLYDYKALEQNVDQVATEADVVYAIVFYADGIVAAHSQHPERVGQRFQGVVPERAADADEPLTQETVSGGVAVYDFAIPVFVESRRWATIRLGLSKRRMDAEIRRTRLELGALTLVTLLLGGVAAALVARRIARPVQRLAEGAAAISRGELNQRFEPSTADEIGRLATAFNDMAAQLLHQRTALEEAHGGLRRQFEELADLKSYTDNILGSLTSGIVTIDLDGRVVTLNSAAELLTGFFRGEASGRYCTELFAHTPDISDLLTETLASHAPITGVPLTLRRRNGSALPIEFSTAPLKGGEGKDLGAIGVFRDVTLVRQLESDLRRSDRLAALGTLAAGLAHEIKNPLTSLLTFSRHLDRKVDDPNFRERFRNVVPRELERINGIVERLLELARPSRMSFALTRLPELLERALELHVEQLDEQHVEVVREYARDVPPIQADKDALYRVFVNLIANALDAMPRGGRLTVRAGWAGTRDPVRAARGQAANRVKIEIEDTGVGIQPSDTDRVFNPFYTTRDSGTGLGLALAHKIIEDHGGGISFESVPGRGTTFKIVLSLIPDPPNLLGDEASR